MVFADSGGPGSSISGNRVLASLTSVRTRRLNLISFSGCGNNGSRSRSGISSLPADLLHLFAGFWVLVGVLLGDRLPAGQVLSAAENSVQPAAVLHDRTSVTMSVVSDSADDLRSQEPSSSGSTVTSTPGYHEIPAKPHPPVRRMYEQKRGEETPSQLAAEAQSKPVRRASLGADVSHAVPASGSPTLVALQVCLRR